MSDAICSVLGCPKSVLARGWCGTHYALWRRNGVPERQPVPTAAERFWAKVDKDGPVPSYRPDLGSCWIWTAAIYVATGYGQFDRTTAHRWAWIDAHGPIGKGFVPDHLCRVRACVRLTHLEVITTAENLRRGAGSGGVLERKPTHCPAGHPYDEANGFADKSGTVRCRICHKAAQARYRAKITFAE